MFTESLQFVRLCALFFEGILSVGIPPNGVLKIEKCSDFMSAKIG